MASTYTYSGDPTASNNDAVRFELGDTDVSHGLVSDEEIAYVLGLEASHILRTCARLAEALAAKYARKGSIQTGPSSYRKSQVADHFRTLAKQFRYRIGTGMFTLQTSKSTILMLEQDIDLPQAQFKRGQHDNGESSLVDEAKTPV